MQRGMQHAWMKDLRGMINEIASPDLAVQRNRASLLAKKTEDDIRAMLQSKEEDAALLIRSVVDAMCIAHSYAAMLRLAEKTALRQEWADLAESFLRNVGEPVKKW